MYRDPERHWRFTITVTVDGTLSYTYLLIDGYVYRDRGGLCMPAIVLVPETVMTAIAEKLLLYLAVTANVWDSPGAKVGW